MPNPILQVMTEIRGYSVSVVENSVSNQSEASSYSDYSDYSYSDYSDSGSYSYSDYSDYSDSSNVTPTVPQQAFKRYRPSFKQQPSAEPPQPDMSSEKSPSSEKTPKSRGNSSEGRVSWKLPDVALQKLTTEVFPRVAEGDTAPVSNVRTLFEQAGIPAGILTSTLI